MIARCGNLMELGCQPVDASGALDVKSDILADASGKTASHRQAWAGLLLKTPLPVHFAENCENLASHGSTIHQSSPRGRW
jgi:hypothetical protein